MEGKISKRELTTLVIGVISLVVLTLSATFAYFQVTGTDSSSTTVITGDIGGATLGTVTLTGGDTELYLGISPYDMSENKKGTTYYSSTTEGSRETSKANAGMATYTATLSGDTTNTVMYACDYEFTVSATGTMLGKDSTENVEVVFEGDIEKTLPLSSSNIVSGTWYGFKESNKERSFNAYLQLTNTDNPQNDLAGTNLSVEIDNTKFECYLNKNDELVGEAYAVSVYTADSGSTRFLFIRSETPISVGDTHDGGSITAVYTGIEEDKYTSADEVPWIKESQSSRCNPQFEDEIRPISTAHWFENCAPYNSTSPIDLTNLNTSLVTNMSYMFNNYHGDGHAIIKVSGWDTSKVIYMNNMFSNMSVDMGLIEISGLETWNTSNTNDMSQMFAQSNIAEGIAISNWNVSSVTDMSSMFNGATISQDLDLSGWDVSNVTSYDGFNTGISGTGALTVPPKFQTT